MMPFGTRREERNIRHDGQQRKEQEEAGRERLKGKGEIRDRPSGPHTQCVCVCVQSSSRGYPFRRREKEYLIRSRTHSVCVT